MTFEFVLLRCDGPVGWLEYNRPPRNAFHEPMLREVRDGLKALVADPQARVIAIGSALEQWFSVGAELQTFDQMEREGMAQWAGLAHEIVGILRASAKPMLAAIQGTAVGGGLEITYNCDLRFCADDARLGQPEISIGFIPPVGATQTLARLLGRSRAIRFLYDGEIIDAQQALEIGLVDELVPPGELRARVQTYGETLAEKPPEALAAIRRTITHGMDLPFGEALALEHEAIVELGGTRNFKEGVRAFLEKRKPEWERE